MFSLNFLPIEAASWLKKKLIRSWILHLYKNLMNIVEKNVNRNPGLNILYKVQYYAKEIIGLIDLIFNLTQQRKSYLLALRHSI